MKQAVYKSKVINGVDPYGESATICCLSLRKEKKMRKLRRNKRQYNNLYAEKSLFLQTKNLRQSLKHERNIANVSRTIQKSSSTIAVPCSPKSNKLTKILKHQIHTAGKSPCSDKFSEITMATVLQKSSKRVLRSSSRPNVELHFREVTVADKIKTQFKSKKQQNVLDEKALNIRERILLRSQNKSKELQGQNDLCNNIIGVSEWLHGSPNEISKSSRCSIRLQSQKLLENNSNNVHLSVSPEFKKQQDILNKKTPCRTQNIGLKSPNKSKDLERQNEIHYNTVIDVSEFQHESQDETAKSSRHSIRLQSKKLSENNSDNVHLSVSPKFKKQQDILNKKTPCSTRKLGLKSPNKSKDLERQNEVHYNAFIGESGCPHGSPNETAKSSRCSIRLQSQKLLENNSDNVHLSVSPEFNKQQSILNEKAPCSTRNRGLKSLNKSKGLGRQNEIHNNKVIDVAEFPHEPPDDTVGSSRKSMRLQAQELLKNNSDNVELAVTKESKHRKSVIQQNAKHRGRRENCSEPCKQLMAPDRISKKHSSSTPKNIHTRKKKSVRKSSIELQVPVMSKSCLNIPVDDLALSPIIRHTKSVGNKLPGRNTLKRKRFIFQTMKRADENYEDDIYEAKEFAKFRKMFPDTSDSELSYSVSTPKIGCQLTPQIHCKTPVYKDCFSPTDYALSRKVAEECIYRNKKRKSKSKSEIPGAPEKKKLEFNEILENAYKVQKEVEKLATEDSTCEDNYFTDDEI